MRLKQLVEHYRVRPGYWFAPKLYGLGATPVTWQGWALTLGFAVLAGLVVMFSAQHGRAYLMMMVPLVLAFLVICWSKTDGGWHWHWGEEDE